MIFVTNNDQLGKNIRYLRQTENLSQEAFAWLIGMDPDTLEAMEAGNRLDFDAAVLMEICRMFRLDVQTLVEDCLE